MTKKTRKVAKKSWANVRRSDAMKARWAKRKEQAAAAVTAPGKTLSERKGLSGDEINAIIDRCAAKGVLSFQYGQLQLLFKKTIDEPKTGHTRRAGGDSLEEIEEVAKAQRKGELQELSDLSSEELEHLKITDPAAYESFIQSGEAEDGP